MRWNTLCISQSSLRWLYTYLVCCDYSNVFFNRVYFARFVLACSPHWTMIHQKSGVLHHIQVSPAGLNIHSFRVPGSIVSSRGVSHATFSPGSSHLTKTSTMQGLSSSKNKWIFSFCFYPSQSHRASRAYPVNTVVRWEYTQKLLYPNTGFDQRIRHNNCSAVSV